ncbi:MAG: hypothetical protein ACI90U_001599 [Pseudomonadales bacterium]|jgi:hypothetical protein
MSRLLFIAAFILGASAIVWTSSIFIGTDVLALLVTLIIGLAYGIGFVELSKYRHATDSLNTALEELRDDITELGAWLGKLDTSLQNSVRLRIESERVALPAPVLTPYLVGLLVMLGLLGTFIGMVDTLQGAVFALEGSTELQAIREGLAAPINGLSLAFGTSVAGVAASAMLGLSSTLSRRDRMNATRLLDTKIGTVLRHFSLVYNRQQTYNAMQAQAAALPNVAQQLEKVAASLAQMGEKLSAQLTNNQNDFHQQVQSAYTALAASVDKSLTESLAESGRQVGESIKPLVVETMAEISKEAKNSQQHLTATAKQQLQAMSESLGKTSSEVATAWQDGLAAQQHANSALVSELSDVSKTTISAIEQSAQSQQQLQQQSIEKMNSVATQQLEEVAKTISNELKEVSSAQQASMAGATASFGVLSAELGEQFKQTTKTIGDELRDISTAQQASIAGSTASFGVLSNELSEQWQKTGNKMDQLVSTLGKELSTLRDDEDKRASAALERLESLETTFASHISNLGKELEEPMTRLIQTASETPKAAAEVIEKLRVEISNNIERDNDLLAERKEMMEQLAILSTSLDAASAQQRDAVEQLVTTSTTMLSEIGTQFSGHVDGELNKISEVADQFAGSAIELSSLGESFGTAVQLYNESNTQLVEHLNRIEQSMDKANTRSEEQMGYYVAQAREIIDHSLLSQKEVFEKMRQLSEAS